MRYFELEGKKLCVEDESISKGKILVADDDSMYRGFIGNTLGENYGLSFAASGKEALAKVGTSQPDLILLDVEFGAGEMNGYDVIKKLKSNHETSRIPVVFTSSYSTDKDIEKGLDLGAEDYIIKPSSPGIIKNKVRIQFKTINALKDAYTDCLTGLRNRHFFEARIVDDWNQAIRNNHRGYDPISFLMIDFDNFKRINDTYGHDAGDWVLRSGVYTMKSIIKRPMDCLVRWGGEEFATLLPSTDQERALIIAEAMRESMAEKNVVTASIGLCTMMPTQGSSHKQLVKRADEAVYEAKTTGRNRVIIAA